MKRTKNYAIRQTRSGSTEQQRTHTNAQIRLHLYACAMRTIIFVFFFYSVCLLLVRSLHFFLCVSIMRSQLAEHMLSTLALSCHNASIWEREGDTHSLIPLIMASMPLFRDRIACRQAHVSPTHQIIITHSVWLRQCLWFAQLAYAIHGKTKTLCMQRNVLIDRQIGARAAGPTLNNSKFSSRKHVRCSTMSAC